MSGDMSKRRYQNVPLEDEDEVEQGLQSTQRYRIPKQGSGNKMGTRSGLFRYVPFGMIVICTIIMCIHVFQFSNNQKRYRVLSEPFIRKKMVQFTTKFGTFAIELFPNEAPKSVENFQKLVDKGFYSDQKAGFYRNEPNFVLQGGSYLFGKKSPYANVPVEYKLPSTERMVVIARSNKEDSGNSEFAIMLHDNSASNTPTEKSPGYTAFGRVARGWHTIEMISKRMKEGFLGKDDVDRQIIFEKVEYVEGITHTWPEVLYQIDRINDVLETPHTVVILSYPNAPELKRLKEIFFKLDATVRVQEIGDHSDHPYEVKVAEALAETDKFPVVFIDDKKMDSLEEIERKYRDGSLQNDVEKAGAMAEKIVWNAIHHNPLVVFSKSYCPYCKKAKETLSEIGAKPLVFELDLRPDGRAIQDYLFTLTGRGTVPNVFIKAKSIGGGDDTQAMYKSGELENALRKAGAIK